MKRIAAVLEGSRSNLIRRLSSFDSAKSLEIAGRDPTLKERIRKFCDERPGYGYPRVTAVLKRKLRKDGTATVNHEKFTD